MEDARWEYIESPTRCMALCTSKDGVKVDKIYAKVWRLDSGAWAYACNSVIWKKSSSFFMGTEPSRKLAIKEVEDGIWNVTS